LERANERGERRVNKSKGTGIDDPSRRRIFGCHCLADPDRSSAPAIKIRKMGRFWSGCSINKFLGLSTHGRLAMAWEQPRGRRAFTARFARAKLGGPVFLHQYPLPARELQGFSEREYVAACKCFIGAPDLLRETAHDHCPPSIRFLIRMECQEICVLHK